MSTATVSRAGSDPEGDSSSSVVARVSTILETFSRERPELALSELVAGSGLPKSTVYRMAERLVEFGWLERSHKRYRLGRMLFELSAHVVERSELRERALPFMGDLYEATHETVHLGVLDGLDVLYIDKLGGHDRVRVPTYVGGRQPLYCTGLGKAMLANAPDELVDKVIRSGLRPLTGHTIVVPSVLRAELAAVAARGVAFDRQESGMNWCCAAAPIAVEGRYEAAISVTGPCSRMDPELVALRVKAAALGVTQALLQKA